MQPRCLHWIKSQQTGQSLSGYYYTAGANVGRNLTYKYVPHIRLWYTSTGRFKHSLSHYLAHQSSKVHSKTTAELRLSNTAYINLSKAWTMVRVLSILALASAASGCYITCGDGSVHYCARECWRVCPGNQFFVRADGPKTETVYFEFGHHRPECVDIEGFSLQNIAPTVHHCDYRGPSDSC